MNTCLDVMSYFSERGPNGTMSHIQSPGLIRVQHSGVSHHNQQGFSPGHSHVEPLGCERSVSALLFFVWINLYQMPTCFVLYLFILDKAKVECLVDVCVVRAASDRRHQDHSPLLTLKLLHRPNLQHTLQVSTPQLRLSQSNCEISRYLEALDVLKFKLFANFFKSLADFLHLYDTHWKKKNSCWKKMQSVCFIVQKQPETTINKCDICATLKLKPVSCRGRWCLCHGARWLPGLSSHVTVAVSSHNPSAPPPLLH